MAPDWPRQGPAPTMCGHGPRRCLPLPRLCEEQRREGQARGSQAPDPDRPHPAGILRATREVMNAAPALDLNLDRFLHAADVAKAMKAAGLPEPFIVAILDLARTHRGV